MLLYSTLQGGTTVLLVFIHGGTHEVGNASSETECAPMAADELREQKKDR